MYFWNGSAHTEQRAAILTRCGSMERSRMSACAADTILAVRAVQSGTSAQSLPSAAMNTPSNPRAIA